MSARTTLLAVTAAAFLAPAPSRLSAQQIAPELYQGLAWRDIGPHRGGRTKAVVGVPGTPVFYVGFVNGGLWKTTDNGRRWTPIFDDQPTGSIGAVAVAPSDPDRVYVGSGEGMQRPDLTTGDGLYRSDDGGRTWMHLGLRDGQQIPQIQVDPRDPDRVYVAVLGHPYGPNEERGVFRSADGGRTFEKVLYHGPTVGAAEVALDPRNPDVVYAVLWESQHGPWENAVFTGPGSGLFKSTNGGSTWREIGQGFPTGEEGLGRIGIGIAPSLPSRIYAIVSAPSEKGGLYRSDDGGEAFARIHTDPRLWGRDGDFNEVKVDPSDPDVVYVANIVAWKSADGGRTFETFRGAPGGDDYQRIWIDPWDPKVIALAADQGVVITVNGGETFSSWYNQPTAQFYHVSTDNAFPYRVCGGQQESGSACVSSRGDDGQLTLREWRPVGVEEYGYVAPDPLDPDIVYGGKVTKYDRRTHDVQQVGPRPLRGEDYFTIRTQPILFSPTDVRTLYFASNTLWKTTDGARTWQQVSPDLTRTDSIVPASVGKWRDTPEARRHHRGVIYTIAPSYVDGDWIWVGTDDGLIHVTRDGGRTWSDVTPAKLRDKPWSKISVMDASHTDTLTAYAAVNTFRLDDLRPHLYVTHDGGVSWTEIVTGIPAGGITNTIKEDPVRRGLLFAGTEQQVFFSVDDGAHWQSLRLNMPATSIRDLAVKDNDLVVGTHGRGFWILDDISPLRQLDAESAVRTAALFAPGDAWRVRWNRWTDTPVPPDEPAGTNPPEGALIYYWLKSTPRGPVTLEILDASGAVVRRFSSSDAPEPMLQGQQVPPRWVRAPERLSAEAGMHRFAWDLRYERPGGVRLGYPISAIDGYTPAEPRGPLVMPGTYSVRLTVDGVTHTRSLRVKMDPRVRTSETELRLQLGLSLRIKRVLDRRDEGSSPEFRRLAGELESLYRILQGSDQSPTPTTVDLVQARLAGAERILGVAASPSPPPPVYAIEAVRYGTIRDFRTSGLVMGADPAERMDIAMVFWLVRGDGRVVLFDSGFHRPRWFQSFDISDYLRPDSALIQEGVDPSAVTDLVVSHAHWDHMGGIDLFPDATVHIQREEYEYYTGPAWREGGRHGGIDEEDILALLRRNMAGKVVLVDGDDTEILPGIRGYTGARHTYASQYVLVEGDEPFVLASDNCYLFRNLETHTAGATFLPEDRAGNEEALRRMAELAGSPERVIPGHDPLQFERFPTRGRVARIRPAP